MPVIGSSVPRIDAREHRQAARIRQGVSAGELTRGETRRLAAEQRHIRADEAVADIHANSVGVGPGSLAAS